MIFGFTGLSADELRPAARFAVLAAVITLLAVELAIRLEARRP